VLRADGRIGSEVATAGIYRRNPQVRQPLGPEIAPVYVVHTQFHTECVTRQNKTECCAHVVVPRPGVKAPELKATPLKPNDPRQQELQRRLEMWRQMMTGMGALGPGGPLGPGGRLGPGIGPGFPPGGGGAEGSGPGAAPALGNPGAPQVDTQYEIKCVPVTESAKYDLAEYLSCREAVLVVAAFPYADQMQEIADALLLDRQQVPRYFHSFEVEKRVFALGDRLRGEPDDLIIWDRQTNQIRRVPYTQDLRDKEQLGWLPVNIEAVAMQVASAIEFERETDPFWQILLSHSQNLAMRLPKMLSSEQYPWKELALNFKEIRDTIEKIKQDQKRYEKPPPEDERLKPNIRGAFEGSETPTPVGPIGGEGGDVGVPRGGLGSGPAPMPPGVGGGGRLPGAGGPGRLAPGIGGAGGTGAAGPRGPAVEGPAAPAPAAPVIYNDWPDYCVIRFLDIFDRHQDPRLDPLNAGARPIGVQYRIRVVLTNPNYNRKDVQRPEMAVPKTLEGPWSPPSKVLPLSRETFVYAEPRDTSKPPDRERPAEVIPLQVHRWLGLILELKKREILAVGDWVVGSTWVGRGEFVGTYTKLPLAVWAPHVPADTAGNQEGVVAVAVARRFGRFVYVPDVETSAFETRSILIDFDNRYTWNDFARTKIGASFQAPADATPQEVLILTEDGRLIARNAQRDNADPDRRKREQAWKDRLEKTKSSPQPGTKPSGNLFGGS
jgi:hypothetical protein